MTVAAIVQARTSSSRLPGKVMRPILGHPMLARQLERVGRARACDKILVATSRNSEDDAIAELCAKIGIGCFRGPLDDVLERYCLATESLLPYKPHHIVRLTGDCPLTDWEVIDLVIERHLKSGADYTSNTIEPSWPDGLDVEVVTYAALQTANRETTLSSDREHVMPFIWRQPARFQLQSVRQADDWSKLRWTVDEPADFAFVTAIYEGLYDKSPAFKTDDIMRFICENSEISAINAGFVRNEGYRRSLERDRAMPGMRSDDEVPR